MSTMTWEEVIFKLLEKNILLEDPSSGIIQIHPEYYVKLGKSIPGSSSSMNLNKERASKLALLYIDLWPKKISSGNRPVRQGPGTITKKLNVFLNKHKNYTDFEILNATARYVAKKKKEEYQYMTCADYFISKNDSSLLEAYLADPELDKLSENKPTVNLNQRFI